LLRLNEGDAVMEMFEGKFGLKVIRADASDMFLGKLRGVSEPEAKRKIIGGLFVDVFKAEAEKLKQKGQIAGTKYAQSAIKSGVSDAPVQGVETSRTVKGATWLAQGTIYPDVIESGGAKSKKAVTIKSHHNVGGLPAQLGLKLLEPLRDLFKDEVRELGVALGLPHAMVYRHPFPGPGLGVRILGEVKKEYADLLRKADAIFIEELRNFKDEQTGKNWYELTSQAFTVFLRQKRRRDGRWPHLRLRRRPACRRHQRFHDRRLGRTPLRLAQKSLRPHHQRSARNQPRDV
jgi:GMP synthase (glutamine-hydrolysing)